MNDEQFNLKKFDKAVLAGKATWWQMDLPSGDVIFGEAKTDMLGYDSQNFNHFEDFTSLIHKDDYEKAMKAMRDHLTGKKDFYETLYRIKNKDGEYVKFYDCGRIVKKESENITVAGFVMLVNEKKELSGQMDDFKKMILEGKPSMIDLLNDIK